MGLLGALGHLPAGGLLAGAGIVPLSSEDGASDSQAVQSARQASSLLALLNAKALAEAPAKAQKVWLGEGLGSIKGTHDRMLKWEFVDLSELRLYSVVEKLEAAAETEKLVVLPGLRWRRLRSGRSRPSWRGFSVFAATRPGWPRSFPRVRQASWPTCGRIVRWKARHGGCMTWLSVRRWLLRRFGSGRGWTSSCTRRCVVAGPTSSLGLCCLVQTRSVLHSPSRQSAHRSAGFSTRVFAPSSSASFCTSARRVGVGMRCFATPRGLLRRSISASPSLRGRDPGLEFQVGVLVPRCLCLWPFDFILGC